MVFKLYGFPPSTNTLRAALILNEKQVPFEFVPVSLPKGEQKQPDYLAKNPLGLVPYLETDKISLYESRAIARYIAELYADQGTKLVPETIEARALYEQAASTEIHHFTSIVQELIWEKGVKPAMGQQTDEAKALQLSTKLDNNLKIYEDILSKQKYIAGDELTLIDLFHVPPAMGLIKRAGLDPFSKYPSVDRWLKELTARPSWQSIQDGAKSSA
ncbi:putative glutathione S-transferase [Flagelloscypha sp. PMI_526]|nr:putative glutathione S-transferase [Flagelloscypha sp. PMI_526]